MKNPKYKISGPPGQTYQLWYDGELLTADSSLTGMLLFAKEQIEEGAWNISKKDYKKVKVVRFEQMEFDFSEYMNQALIYEDRVHKEVGKARPAKSVRYKK